MPGSRLVAALTLALAFAVPGAAHVVASPSFLPAGATETIVPASSESVSASSSGSGRLVAVLVGVGLRVAGGVAALASLRRARR